MIIRISSKNKPTETKKALERLARLRKRRKKTLIDFYGKMPGIYGNALTYQKQIRDEWS